MNIDGYDAWRLQSPPEVTECCKCHASMSATDVRRWFGDIDEIECDDCDGYTMADLADTLEYRGER